MSLSQCPHCLGQTKSKVTESRAAKFDGSIGIRRRRVCQSCGGKFRTLEIVDWRGLLFPESPSSPDTAIKNLSTGAIYCSHWAAGAADGHSGEAVLLAAEHGGRLSSGDRYCILERNAIRREWLIQNGHAEALPPEREWKILAGKQLIRSHAD